MAWPAVREIWSSTVPRSVGTTVPPARAPSWTSEPIRWWKRSLASKSSHGVGLGRSSGPRRRRTGCTADEDRLGGCHRVQVLGDPRELVGSRFARGGDLLQALEVVLPALGVLLRLLLVEALVGEGHLGAVRRRLDHDGHRRGARRERLVLVPAEGEHEASSRFDLADGARGVVPGGDGPAEVTACAEVDVRRDGEPAADALRLGDERERLVGGHGQQHGLVEAHLFLLSCSASSTSESSSSVQNRLISACSFCSPDGRTR